MTDFRRTQNTFGDAFPTDDALHGGFNFDNCRRNELLLGQPGQGGQKIKAMKTGTTIVGVVYKVRKGDTSTLSFVCKGSLRLWSYEADAPCVCVCYWERCRMVWSWVRTRDPLAAAL